MNSYTIARGMHFGWVTVRESSLPAEFLRKRVVIESLDENGQVIDKTEASQEDKDSIMAILYAKYGVKLLIDELYPTLFSDKEYSTAIEVLELQFKVIPTESDIMKVRSLFDSYGHNKIGLASEMGRSSEYFYGYFSVSPKSPYYQKKFTFEEALDFLNERDGLYYAVNNEGKRCYDFVDKPKKSQITYQKNNNGNEVVFLDFQDWNEYKIS